MQEAAMQERNPPPAMLVGFNYLRDEAIDAHLAGDGTKVLHLCVVALEQVEEVGRLSPDAKVDLKDVRWAFFLGLYWFLDDWLIYTIDSALAQVRTDGLSSYDKSLIAYLGHALSSATLEPPQVLATECKEWIVARAEQVEDIAALTLAIELDWYHDPKVESWKKIADGWLEQCPDDSLLRRELQRLKERLPIQGVFCTGGGLPNRDDVLLLEMSSEQRLLLEAWKLYYDARFVELDNLIQNSATLRIPVESPVYPALFCVMQISRIARESHESQFSSLSRLNLTESHQPSQVVATLRDKRFAAAYGKIARAGFPDNVANDRLTCFRMAMLNQIHALRAWDIGGWIGGEQQYAQIALELGARGNLPFAKAGVIASVRSFATSDLDKYPHLNCCVQLLDALPGEERREIVQELIRTPRILWASANRIIAELSDAIPTDILGEVAQWSVRLHLDEHHTRGTATHMETWGTILWWAPNSPALIELLKPALVSKARTPMCWDSLYSTFVAAIIKGEKTSAAEILSALLETPCEDAHWNEKRFWILRGVAIDRPEMLGQCMPWLQHDVEARKDRWNRFLIEHLGANAETPIDDADFRQWLEASLLQECDSKLAETTGNFSLGGRCHHTMMLRITWPEATGNIVKKLAEVVDAEYVPFMNKFEPIACLAVLVRLGPEPQAHAIAAMSLQWLHDGIKGKDLGLGGPLSIGQISGAGPENITRSMSFLLDELSQRCPEIVGPRLAEWIFIEGVRTSADVVDRTIRTALHLSIALYKQDPATSIALVGATETAAHLGMGPNSNGVIAGFRSVVFAKRTIPATSEWLASPAGMLCLEMWQRRLVDAARSASPEVRAAVARTLSDWKQSGLKTFEQSVEVLGQLTKDCRLRVQSAAKTDTKD
jgi:hypothetical protein